MRKRIISGLLLTGLLVTNVQMKDVYASNRAEYGDYYYPVLAADYAKKYAESPNEKFPIQERRDCTSFVSQCIASAGMYQVFPDSYYTCKEGTKKSLQYWCFLKRKNGTYVNTTSFVRTDNYGFYEYMNDTRGIKCYKSCSFDEAKKMVSVGDVIQIEKKGDSVHSIIVTEIVNGRVYCSSHSDYYYNKNFFNINTDAKKEWGDITYKVIKMTQYK